MNLDIFISFMGIFVFATIMFFAYKYSSGNWQVSQFKKVDYLEWSNKNGQKLKKLIIVVSVIYVALMIVQLLSYL